MKTFLLQSRFFIAAFLVANLVILGTAHGQKTFNTNSGSWATSGNWTPNGIPAAGDDVIFPSTVTSVTNVPNASINSVTIQGTSGTIAMTSSSSGDRLTVTTSFSLLAGKTLTIGNGNRLNMTFASTCTATIAGTLTIYSGTTNRDLTNNGDLTITSAGLINESGSGSDFILSAGATLRIGSTAGITTAGTSSGNVQTAVRTFNVGANYVYNGTANQSTGTGYPTNLTGSLTINNPGNTVTLSAARTIANTGSVFLTNGTFSAGTNLTMASTSSITRSGGTVTGTFQGSGVYDVTYTGNSKTTGIELVNTGLRNITVNLTSGQVLTLDANRAPDGNLSVSSGTFNLSTFTINRSAAGGTLSISNDATLKIDGTNTVPSNYSTHSIGATSTIEYSGANQSVASLNSSQAYGNLTLTGSGSKTFSAITTIANSLSIATGVVANLGIFTHNTTTLTLGGVLRETGSWGSTSSVPLADYTNNTFFAATTGKINVSNKKIYSADDTFTVPNGVTSITVEAWGGGGGGANPSNAAGGGGGGAFTEGALTGLTPGSNLIVIVGVGGGPGVNGASSNVSTILANGGSTGSNRTGGAGGAASPIAGGVTASYEGGAGGNGRASTTGSNNEGGGGGGGSATTTANGGAGSNASSTLSIGGAGGTGTGDGGNGANGNNNPAAQSGQVPGGGGGGRGEASGTSGSGANGQVIVSWSTCSAYTATIAGTATICTGGSTNLTVTISAGGTSPYTVVYTDNLGNTATAPAYTSGSNISVSPAGTRTYTLVSVTDASGCTATNAGSAVVTVVADPAAPTATKSPNVATVCEGQSLTLTGVTDNGGGTGTCNIEYSHNGGPWTTTLTPLTAAVGSNTIAIRKNCNGSGCDISPVSTYSWTGVADPSAPTATKSPNVATVCEGQALTLTGVTDNGGGTGTCNIEYSHNGGPWTTTLTPLTAAVGSNTIAIRKNCNGSGCDISPVSTYSWTGVAPPICTIAGPVEVCLGAEADYSVPDAGPGATYEWGTDEGNGVFFGPGSEPFEGTVTFGMPSPGQTTLSVHIIDANGCESSCTLLVDVLALPVCDITGPVEVCLGAEADYSVPDAGPGATYEWDTDEGNGVFFGPGSEPFEGTVFFGMPSPGQTILSVQITDANGCESSCSISVDVLALPVCTISGPPEVCENTTGHGYSTPEIPGNTYAWTIADNGAINGADDEFSVTVDAGLPGTFTLTLTVTDENGCSSSCTKMVTVLAGAAVSLTLGDDQCYLSGQVFLTGGLPAGGTYSGPGVSGGVFDGSIGLGTYTITYSFPGGCPTGTATDEMTVHGGPLLLAVNGPAGPIPCQSVVPLSIMAVSGFTDIISAQFAVQWNPAQWQYVSATPIVLPGFNIQVNDFPGHIIVSISPDEGTTFPIPTEMVELELRSLGCGPTIPIEIRALDLVPTSPIEVYTDEFAQVPVQTMPWNAPQQDNQPPVIQPLPPVIQEWIAGFSMSPKPPNVPQDPSVDPDITGTPVVMDNCTPMPGLNFSDVMVGPTPTNCPVLWTLHRTWVATDNCGNTATYTQVISFTDFTLPVISCPPPVTLEWPAGFNMNPPGPNEPQDPSVDPANTGGPATATDNCGTPAISYQDVLNGPFPGNCPYLWTLTRSWKATDNCGLMSNCVQTITFSDNTPPEFTACPSMTIDLGCTAPTEALAITHAGPATDNCGTPTISTDGGSSVEFAGCIYTQSWLVTATDNCGTTTNCLLTFNWKVDTELPSFPDCPAEPIFIGCNPVTPPAEAEAIAAAGTPTDNCGIMSVDAFPDDVVSDACNTSALWRVVATDMCGNTATCLVTFSWTTDTENPEFPECPTMAIDLGCNPPAITEAQAIMAAGMPTDNCGIMSVTAGGGSIVETGCLREQSWTVTAIDNCLNEGQCVVNFVWKEDLLAPEFTNCPTMVIDLGCNPAIEDYPDEAAAIAAAGAATDNCGTPVITVVPDDVVIDGCTTTELWRVTATDMCMNKTDCVVGFTWIEDTEAPEFPDCPAEPVDLGCNPAAVTEAQAIADAGNPTDNCLIVDISALGGAITEDGCKRMQVWTVTAVDICENEGTCAVTYTWTEDNDDPEFENCPTMVIPLSCNSNPSQADALAVIGNITDNCGTPEVSVAVDNDLTNCIYTRSFTVTATDDCDNTAECVVVYTWTQDTEKPLITTLATSGYIGCNPTVVAPIFTGTDNCEGAIIPAVTTTGSSNIGCAYTQTWNANYTDACGNVADQVSITYTWTVDVTKPVITTLATSGYIGCNPMVLAPTFTGTDNCEGAITPAVTTTGSSNVGCDYTQTWDANYTDVCGNVADQVSITYTWKVATPVILTCPLPTVETSCQTQTAIDQAFATWLSTVSYSGGCNPSISDDNTGAPPASGGMVTVTWTVESDCEDDVSCSATFTVSACITISGNLIWRNTDDLTGVGAAYVDLTGDATDTDGPTPAGLIASGGGAYAVEPGIPGNFVVKPRKNPTLFTFNGVDAADATAVQQHLVGLATVTDFFRLVAADVNKSYSISTLDAALIRQGILGNPSALAILNATGDWRFVNTDYPDVATNIGPYLLTNFSAYEKRNLTGVTMDMPDQDFWGIKIGDMYESGGSGTANPALKPDPSAKPLVWYLRDRLLTAGQTIDLDFSVTNFTDIAAFQYGMFFDPTVLQFEAVTVTGKGIPLDVASNFGAYQAANGELRTLWSVAQGLTLPGVQPMYRLRFKVLRSGSKLSEVLSFDPAIIPAVAYTTDLAPRQVLLVFTTYGKTGLYPRENNVEIPGPDFELLQNRPNPFSEGTTIGFILPEACDAQLRVFDISGRELLRIDNTYPAGYNEERIQLRDIRTTGMLYYELTTLYGKLTRKMNAVGP